MEIVFFCLPTNDMLIIFYINFNENSSFNEKKNLCCLMNQYFEYLRNEVPILTYFLKSIRKIKKKKFEPLSKCYVLFTP